MNDAWAASYQGARVAVFGASGFIGRWVTHRLLAEGAEVYGFVRSPDRSSQTLARYGMRPDSARLDLLQLDMGSLGRVEDGLSRLNPDVVFNLVAYGVNPADADEILADEINAQFPAWLGRAVANLPDSDWSCNRLVHVGTQYEYGPVEEFHEDVSPEPSTIYGASKLEGTRSLMKLGETLRLRAVTARVFNVFGPGEGPHRLLPLLMRTARDPQPLELTSGEQERDFCVVDDVAEGLLRLGATQPLHGDVVNLASGRLVRVKDLILEAAHQLQISPSLLQFGARPDRPQEVLKPLVSVSRLHHLTGWLPSTPIVEGIRRTVAFVPQAP